MRFEISHEIEYKYSRPVFLEPHTFFLRPREDAAQKLLRFEIQIDPAPVLSSGLLDAFGNFSLRTWFKDLQGSLKIKTLSEVETVIENPFNYLPDDSCVRLPARYAPLIQQSLSSYRSYEPVHPSVAVFADKIAAQAHDSTVVFLLELCREIAADFKKLYRPEGEPWPGFQTLEKKQGSCRDLTVLFMECCRAQGLAARFTSGYYEGESGKEEKELHAWAEVYLEGGGWRGFDPTAGLAAGETHVAIASANPPELVSPVQGTFRGSEVTSKMTTRVRMIKKACDAAV